MFRIFCCIFEHFGLCFSVSVYCSRALEPSSTNSVAVIVFVAIAVVAVAQLSVTLFIVVVLLWEPCFRSGADFSVFFLILLLVIAFLLQCSSLARRTPWLSALILDSSQGQFPFF